MSEIPRTRLKEPTMKRFSYVATAALLTLAGCQRTAQFEADKSAELQSVMVSYSGQTIADFQRKNSNFALVGGNDVQGGRTFVFETSPVYVTFTSPGYTPLPRVYNDPVIRSGFNNLGAAMSASPAVSRTTANVCRVTIFATPTSLASKPESWLITQAEASGAC